MQYNLDEAIRILSAHTLAEVQTILGLSDDDIIDILLNKRYDRKIMDWYADYINNESLRKEEGISSNDK